MAKTERKDAAARSQGELDEAFDKLQEETPNLVTRAISWLRKPQARMVRLPLGILFICAGFLWFLPALGLWCLPLGLLLIAQDVPFLRRPVGRMTLYLLEKWVRLRKWCTNRRARAKARKARTVA